MSNVDAFVVRLANKTKFGIGIWMQGSEFMSACLDKEGKIAEPRNWMPHKTVEQALENLLRKID